ncbi:MAG: YdeI/OmpD-associated family protein [Opitutaceae bacterium]|nr:YdeI/OmpD-associated family protein [Opitutaceae bacterium]
MTQQTPLFFATAAEFGAWLATNSATASELIVGFWKVDSGRPCMTWPESVDEALCFGWIDGVRKRIDADSYQIRFTPRKPGSIWSAVNIAKFVRLQVAKRTYRAGEDAFARRTSDRSVIYAYEQPKTAELTSAEQRQFRRTKAAWRFFQACPPSYRKVLLHWVTAAKKPQTRAARLEKLIQASRAGERLR